MYENAQAELKYLDEARAHVRDYVNQHPQCADLALSLWPSGTRALYREHTKTTASTSSSSSNSVSSSVISSSSTPADHKSDPAAAITRFPSSTVSPPIWVDLPSLQIHHGVELTSHPHQQQKHQQAQTVIATSSATTTDAALAVVAPLKVLMTSDMSNACATELVRLLKLTPETLPAARFKSTLASSHIYW